MKKDMGFEIATPVAPPPGPAPEILAQEEAAWQKVIENLADEQAQKEYMGFCIKNNLITSATKRYGAVADAKDQYTIEQRRLARLKQQQLASIMFMSTAAAKSVPRDSRYNFATCLEIAGVSLLALMIVVSLFLGTWGFLIIPMCASGLIIYVYLKVKQYKARQGE